MSQKKAKAAYRAAKIKEAEEWWDKYTETIEDVFGTLHHGVGWSGKKVLDPDDPNYIEEEKTEVEGAVLQSLTEQALLYLTNCCIAVEDIYCPNRHVYFKTLVKFGIKIKKFKAASMFALLATKKKDHREYFMALYEELKDKPDSEDGDRVPLDISEFEVDFSELV